MYILSCRRENYDDTDSTKTDTAKTATLKLLEDSASVTVKPVPYLLIRTELCGRTLKQWLDSHGHEKRKRERLLPFFEQVGGKI